MTDDELARTRLFDRVEADLASVEAALERLDTGTYWSCEVCQAPLVEVVLAEAPLTRRCPEHAAW